MKNNRNSYLPFYRIEHAESSIIPCFKSVLTYHDIRFSDTYFNSLNNINSDEDADRLIFVICDKFNIKLLKISGPSKNDLRKMNDSFIIHVNEHKFVLVFKVNNNTVVLSDPNNGNKELHIDQLADYLGIENISFSSIYVLKFTPSSSGGIKNLSKKINLLFYTKYALPYRKFFIQIAIGFFVNTVLQLLPPLLTRAMIDKGVNFKNISFVEIILIGMIAIQIAKAATQFTRDWISYFIGNRINISIISDFINHLLKLPILFFDSVSIGELMQRIGDHKKIEQFLTKSLVSLVFSLINILVVWGLLVYFNTAIFIAFMIGSLTYVVWVLVFTALRKQIEASVFSSSANNQNFLINTLQNIQEIKLQGGENAKRLEWERLNINNFHLQEKMAKFDQLQSLGATLINEIKNIIILYISAKQVIDGNLTLGAMLAVQYVIGQANQPIYQLIKFAQDTQSAKFSIDKLSEINNLPLESSTFSGPVDIIPEGNDIVFDNVTFGYSRGKNQSTVVLNKINFSIPQGKTTVFIGSSGSGKTTLLKLMLKFYHPVSGSVKIDDIDLKNFDTKWWRSQCGAIMQDSVVFNDSIINNICASGRAINMKAAIKSAVLANIHNDISNLSHGYETKVGSNGHKLSQGQAQRLLLARLFYRDPNFIFIDEATSALDFNNESIILKNIFTHFKDKTIVIVTHRINTAKYADNLVVMENGKIIEFGKPEDLLVNEGAYYKLLNKRSIV